MVTPSNQKLAHKVDCHPPKNPQALEKLNSLRGMIATQDTETFAKLKPRWKMPPPLGTLETFIYPRVKCLTAATVFLFSQASLGTRR